MHVLATSVIRPGLRSKTKCTPWRSWKACCKRSSVHRRLALGADCTIASETPWDNLRAAITTVYQSLPRV
jgi:hypothetical protein